MQGSKSCLNMTHDQKGSYELKENHVSTSMDDFTGDRQNMSGQAIQLKWAHDSWQNRGNTVNIMHRCEIQNQNHSKAHMHKFGSSRHDTGDSTCITSLIINFATKSWCSLWEVSVVLSDLQCPLQERQWLKIIHCITKSENHSRTGNPSNKKKKAFTIICWLLLSSWSHVMWSHRSSVICNAQQIYNGCAI